MLIIFNVIFIAFIAGIIIFIQQYKKKKALHFQELESEELRHQEELLKTQIEIQEQTMKSFGREIHDSVGQKLTLSSIYLQQLIFDEKSPEIDPELEHINTIIDEAIKELRQLSRSLTDYTIKTVDLEQLVAQECEKINELKKYEITFRYEKVQSSIPYTVKSVVIRIVQEFFTNSLKHSNCEKLYVAITEKEANLEVVLTDDGIGFDTEKTYSGIGLKNIKKRVAMLEGVIRMENRQIGGTQLFIRIPLQ
ncbi:sensor histidine kinase [Flavobacteriaceae bacterium M23B6Z8]